MTKKQDTSTVVAVVSAKPFMDALAHCQRVVLDTRKPKEQNFHHDALYVAHIVGSENEQTVRVEATDGVRLFSALIAAAMVTDFEAFIGDRAIPIIRSAPSMRDGDLVLHIKAMDAGAQELSIKCGPAHLIASWGKNLSWPNTAQIDPRRQYGATWIHRMPNRITALRAQLIHACDKAVKAKSDSIWLKSEFGGITVAWHDIEDQDEFRGVQLRATGEDDEHSPEQCFDPRYLRDALRTGEQGDSITIYCPVKTNGHTISPCIVGETVLMPRHDLVNPFSNMEQKGA